MAFWNVPNRTIMVEGENGYELYGDFQADTFEDLDDNLDGVTIAKGSAVQIVQAEGPTFLTMGSNGTWYPEQSDSSKSLNMSAPLTLGKTIKPGVIEPETFEQNDIEQTEKPEGGEEDAELL